MLRSPNKYLKTLELNAKKLKPNGQYMKKKFAFQLDKLKYQILNICLSTTANIYDDIIEKY